MLQLFGLLSGILPAIATFPYIRDILKGKTRPHSGSFLIWAVLGSIAFFTQLAEGATFSLFFPAVDTFATLTIFLLSLKYGFGKLKKYEIGSLVVAGIGLVIWFFTKQPLTALLIAVGIDAIGTMMTVIKTYHDPHSETFSAWLLNSLAGLFAALAVGKLDFALLVYPLYIFIANLSIDAVIVVRRPKVPK